MKPMAKIAAGMNIENLADLFWSVNIKVKAEMIVSAPPNNATT